MFKQVTKQKKIIKKDKDKTGKRTTNISENRTLKLLLHNLVHFSSLSCIFWVLINDDDRVIVSSSLCCCFCCLQCVLSDVK